MIRVGSTVNDHNRNTKSKNLRTYVVSDKDVVVSIPTDSGDVVKSIISPSRKRVATLREVPDSSIAGGKKRIVEVWEKDNLFISFDVSKTHGAFYNDGRFLPRGSVIYIDYSSRDTFVSVLLAI